jgi:predicted N-acyltransferase
MYTTYKTKLKPKVNTKQTPQDLIKEKYNIAQERKYTEVYMDTVIIHMSHHNIDGTYNSFGDFLDKLQEKVEKRYPQLNKENNTDQVLKVHMLEGQKGIYLECEVYRKFYEPEKQTVARLMREEKKSNIIKKELAA